MPIRRRNKNRRTPQINYEPVIEFFEYVRSVQQGEIRCLEVRHGLPFHMEIAQQPGPTTGAKHG
jgi:hypothetical protein